MTVSLRYLLSFSFVIAMVFSSPLSQNSMNSLLTEKEGFSIELVHRDSPQSPYFNRKETRSERAYNTLTRSIARVKYLASTGYNSREEPIARLLYHGQYLVNISLGTPPVPILGIVDTGSNLIWTQCRPCFRCFKQDYPLFDPQRSSTYQDVSCFSKECDWLGDARCDPIQGRICQYYYNYVDGGYSKGNFARETMTLTSGLGEPLYSNRILFGCGHDNRLRSVSGKSSGFVGLASGPMSLVSQLGEAAAGKLSYCLPSPYARSSKKLSGKLSFGKRASVSGLGTVCTPLLLKYTYYHLTLKSVTVVSVSSNTTDLKDHLDLVPSSIGNILIDSGADVSYLSKDFYYRLESTVAQYMKSSTRVPSPTEPLQLCYRTLKSTIDAPFLIFHFENADLKLGPANTFYRVSKDVWCFGFAPVFGREVPQVFGAHQQASFLIGYDLQQKVLCFKAMDCANSDI